MTEQPGKPHIVLITADELRKDALGCYGNEAVATPNLDRLAAASWKFERAYTASPWCLPSRCALVTGKLPHNNGAYSNFRECRLDPETPNLMRTLKQGGYRTSVFGKCHFIPVKYSETRSDRTLPYEAHRSYYLSLGIDELQLQDGKLVSAWYYDDFSKELDAQGMLEAYRAAAWDKAAMKVYPYPLPGEWHPDRWVGRKAAEFIAGYDREEPLFTWISFSGPHYPFDAPAEYNAKVNRTKLPERHVKAGELDDPARIHHSSYHGPGRIDGAGAAPDKACKNYTGDYWERLTVSYYANIALIDEQIGHILEAVRERLGDNTVIIFTADHGEMLGHHGIWGKNNCAYEDVWNVPLLVKFPGEAAQEHAEAKVMLTDLMATCLTAAGLPLPATDGVDLKTLLQSGGRRYVVCEGEGFAAISDGSVKYIQVDKPEETFTELIDLSSDPNEFHNALGQERLADKSFELQRALTHMFMRTLLT